MTHLEPAKSVVEKVGGPREAAKITGRDVSRVYRWMYRGEIPSREARKLLDYARENNLALKAEDFFPAEFSAEA